MSGLTQALRLQHQSAEKLLAQITEAVDAGDMERVGALLKELDELVIPHLSHEDERLYSRLTAYAEARGERELAQALKQFTGSMHFVSEAARAFFLRYDGHPPRDERFRADWASLREELRTRMLAEEATIFPLYDRAMGAEVPTI